MWKSTSRVDGVRVDAVDCSQVIPIADLVEVSMYDQLAAGSVKCRGRFGTRRYVLSRTDGRGAPRGRAPGADEPKARAAAAAPLRINPAPSSTSRARAFTTI